MQPGGDRITSFRPGTPDSFAEHTPINYSMSSEGSSNSSDFVKEEGIVELTFVKVFNFKYL